MRIGPKTTLRDLAFIVCTSLDENGTVAVLTGGGAATIYSEEAYSSRDLDFVLLFRGIGSASALEELGFTLKNSMYVHPDTPFTVEFPPGPLAIGDDYSIKYRTLHDGGLKLHIIEPTDSVLDRLAAYVHWKDRGSLHSAALVASALGEQLDWIRVEDWCKAEGVIDKVADLKAAIEALR